MSLPYPLMKWSAMGWLALGLNDRACEAFNRMLARWPQDAYALSSRSHVHAQAGRLPQALADVSQWVKVDPDNGHAWFNQGFLLESLERYEDALPSFRKATELSPELDRAWYGLGLVLIRMKRYDEAVTALKRNTELQPMSPYGWYQLARVHVDRRDPDAAVKIIKHLKGFEPKVAAQLERETGLLTSSVGSSG